MASRKIPERTNGRVSFVGEALSFAYFSLGQQRKVSRSPAGEWKLCFCSWPPQPTLKQHQTLSSAGAAEFISFVNRQKKRNQRKTIPRQGKSGPSFVPGFFDSPSMARSKNAAHPWAAPSGSAVCHDHSSASRSNSQSQSQSQKEPEPQPRAGASAGAAAGGAAEDDVARSRPIWPPVPRESRRVARRPCDPMQYDEHPSRQSAAGCSRDWTRRQ